MAQYEIVFNRGKDQLHKLETCSNKMRLQMLKENKQLGMKFLVHTNHFLVDMSPDSGPHEDKHSRRRFVQIIF